MKELFKFMTDYFNKLEAFWQNTVFSFLAIAVIFIFDSLTPLGFAAWILYMIPVSVMPYKKIDRTRIYIVSSIITILIWSGFYLKPPGTIAPQIALANRTFITLVLWVITYVQIQRSNTHKNLSKSKEELRKNEEQLRLLAEGMPLFIWTAEPDGNIDFFSGHWNEFSENLVNDGLGWNWQPAIHPDDLEYTVNSWKESLNTGKELEILHRLKRNDGEYRWRLTRARPMKDPSGKILKWYGTSTDINKQKLLEEKLQDILTELKRNQIRFEKAEALAHVGSYQLDTGKGIAEISHEMARILGLDPDKKYLHLDEFNSFLHPEDKELITRLSSNFQKEGTPTDLEYRIIRSDGDIRYIHAISETSNEDDAEESNIRFGAIKDITERKTVEIAIQKERELFESIFSSIPVMITIYDPDLKSFSFNNALHNILGWTLEDAADENFLEKVYPDPSERMEVTEFMQSLKPGWKEFTLTAKDGRRVESSWSNIRLTSGVQIGIGIDLHDIKHAEKSLRESQEKLIEAQKLASLGNYSIDFKNGAKMEWSDEMYNIWELDKNKPLPTVEDVWKRVHPDDLEELKRVLYNQLPGGERVETIFRILFPGGRIKYVHIITRVTFDEKGNLLRR
ncbi:MAG: PAS domain-containing protein [Bacillota bacterium]